MSKRSKAIGMRLGEKTQLLPKSMNSTFYTAVDLLRQDAKSQIEAIRNFKPAIEIDRSLVQIEIKPMTPSEKAFMLARKYKDEDQTYTLKDIWKKHKNKEMNQANIDTVNRIVMSIKALATSEV